MAGPGGVSDNPYGRAADLYYGKGWRGILPLPHRRKKLPPAGFTGSAGTDPAYPDIAAWADGTEGPKNICLRLPENVIGIDVDAYGEKTGAFTFAQAEQQWGELPNTWTSTSRNDGISGIRLYRIPPHLAWPGEVGAGVETVHRGHRYVVCWPSIHPDTSDTYRWIDPDGVVAATALPDPDLLPMLPDTWVEGLTGGEAAADTPRNSLSEQQAMLWVSTLEHAGDAPCARTLSALSATAADLTNHSAHDSLCAGVTRLLRLADEGHHGVINALVDLRAAFTDEVTNDRRILAEKTVRTKSEADREWRSALVSGVNLISADRSGITTCDCLGNLTDAILGDSGEPPPTTDGSTGTTESESIPGTDPRYPQLVTGAQFVLSAPESPPAIWGFGDEVLWAEGESLMIVGPPGVGKTTLTGQLLRGRLTGRDPLLGWGISPTTSRVLYLAMDRPAQIARSLRRHFDEGDRDLLEDKLRVWQGPPPGDIAKSTPVLVNLAKLAGADTVIVDSVKDAAIGLSDDTIGAAYNQARQLVLAAGIQMVELHHLVKRGPNGSKPTQLADVYGSVWLTSGAGSVLLLWGQAGDSVVGLTHLKQPAEDAGPLEIRHDHTAGTTTIFSEGGTSLGGLLAANATHGLTPRAAAYSLYGHEGEQEASRNEIEKTRRKLEAMVAAGHARVEHGAKGGDLSTRKPSRYYPSGATTNPVDNSADQSRTNHGTNHAEKPDQSRGGSKKGQFPHESPITAPITPITAPITRATVPVRHTVGSLPPPIVNGEPKW